jgi:hypothetical protein
VSFHGARNIVTKVVREMSKLFGLFFLLFSLNVSAGTDIFTCKLDAKKTRGWIPTNLVISFLEDGKTAKINYGHKPDSIRVVKYGWKFKEADASISMKTQDGKRLETNHKITIFENNKVIYDFTAVGTSSHYIARGTCTAKLIKTNVPKQQTPTKANIPNQTSTNSCLTTPARCTDSQLCESATFSNYSGTKIWRGSSTAAIHVSEAKSRRLKCGTDGIVTENSSQKISVAMCSTNATACTPRQVCEMATYVTGSKRKWKTTSSSAQYVQQAKQLGLSCEVIRHVATAVTAKPKVQATNTASKSKPLYAAQKLACADIGFVVGTTEFANCVLQLATQQNTSTVQKSRPSYSSVLRICEAEAGAGAASTYRPTTSSSSTYRSKCTSWNNSLNCNTTGGSSYDGGLSNLGHTLSKNANKNRLFDSCVLKYGYEPPKRKTLLQKLFGTN